LLPIFLWKCETKFILQLQVLRLLFEANKRGHIVPISEFYNDVVNSDHINLNEQYVVCTLCTCKNN
jgi:hypothetical protein